MMPSHLCQAIVCALGCVAAAPVQDEGPAPAPPAQQAGDVVVPSQSLAHFGKTIPDIATYRTEPLKYVRRMQDIVQLDLDGVDVNADPVLMIDGEPVSRMEFRRRAVMYLGEGEISQKVTQVLSRKEIERLVREEEADPKDFLLGKEDLDKTVAETLEQFRMATENSQGEEAGQQAVDDFLASVEASIGMEAYRELLSSQALFEKVFLKLPDEATGEELWDLSQGPIPEDDPRPTWFSKTTWEALGGSEEQRFLRNMIKAHGAEGNPIPPFFKGHISSQIREAILGVSGLVFFYEQPLPEGVLFRCVGQDVTVDDLWPRVEGILSDADTDIILRELLTLRAMEGVLEQAGAWHDDEAFAQAFEAHEAEYQDTLLPLPAMLQFLGYGSMERYAEHYRYKDAYQQWREKTLTDEEIEDHYRMGGRLFFEQGTVHCDTAFLAAGAEQFNMAAFRAAEARVREAFQGVETREQFAAVAATGFTPGLRRQGEGQEGAFQRNVLRMRFTESYLSIFLNGYSMADDMFYHAVPGQTYGPLSQRCRRHTLGAEVATGTWLARVNGFGRQRPLEPLESVHRLRAINDYLDLNFLYWSQECLEALLPRVSLPGADS